jgi:nucleoside phosphorylase
MELEVETAITDLRSRLTLLGDWNSKESIGREKPIEIPPASTSDPRLYGNESWRNSVIKSLQTAFPQNQPARLPLFRSASIVSSGTLVKSTELAKQWQQTARHASAVEMELTGVWLAARYADQGTRVLAIRGLSDIIGYSRDPAWTEYAAYSAASFMHALITSGIISRQS